MMMMAGWMFFRDINQIVNPKEGEYARYEGMRGMKKCLFIRGLWMSVWMGWDVQEKEGGGIVEARYCGCKLWTCGQCGLSCNA